MAPETLVFMPNGDVTLTLIRNVFKEEENATNGVDKQPEATPRVEPEAPAEPEEPEESVLFYAPDPPESEYFEPPPRAARGSNASSRRDRSASPPPSFWASLKRQAARVGDPIEDEDPVSLPKAPQKPERILLSSHEVRCVVSSRHMMLASHYFEKMLSGNSNEATTLRTKGHVSIPLSGDLDAMIILLNIVHGVSRKVPRQVSLEVLSKLAVLVSVFGMLDAVQFFSDTWIDNFQRKGFPESYNDDVLPLLFIFWVFDRPSEFKTMTRLVQRECDEKVGEDLQEVPIPHSIIDAIKRDREFAIESAITIIHTLINKYMDGRTVCDVFDEELGYACDAMVLGSLMKSSRKIGIWPKPEAPFSGKKFKDLARAIRSIKVLDVCKKTSSRRIHTLGPSSNCHGLESSIETAMKSIEAGIDGLELSDYPKTSDDFNSGLQMGFQAPLNNELNEETKEEREQNSPIYGKEEEEAWEPLREVKKVPETEPPVFQPKFATPVNLRNGEETPQRELNAAPRQCSTDSLQGARFSARITAQEVEAPAKSEGHPNTRNSPIQEARTPSTVIAKVIDEPPKGQVNPLAERTLNRVPSFREIPKDDVKPPVKEIPQAPRVVSSEAVTKTSSLEQKNLKQPTFEVRAASSDTLTTTEDEETVVLPTFKMRKSKKKFSTKF